MEVDFRDADAPLWDVILVARLVDANPKSEGCVESPSPDKCSNPLLAYRPIVVAFAKKCIHFDCAFLRRGLGTPGPLNNGHCDYQVRGRKVGGSRQWG
ncbi:hypothetical protein Poly41_47200 [Novipirellula artificiosorum]|uniref:Uncharacterized protein n=1 Tax=Novipirellula artificiosorum TaxID=2528016 RepID=A0A5C6DCX4_9BACT|nr:hypothetical protein Poly41_47200 [Novipirellula artificiosorum]